VNKHVILKGSFVAVFYHCMFDSFLIELFYWCVWNLKDFWKVVHIPTSNIH
jgi:hypothetical protein